MNKNNKKSLKKGQKMPIWSVFLERVLYFCPLFSRIIGETA
jgi:hypothetical protein